MQTFSDIQAILLKEKPFLKEKYNITAIGVFGSFARGEQHKKSDVDILVEFSKTPGFFEFIEIENYLRRKLKRKVDLVTKDAIKPILEPYIFKDMVYL
jgi:predicted nucleotidyltransferase